MNKAMTRYEALLACLKNAETQEKLASDMRVTQPTVSRWLHSSKQLPPQHVLRAERLYGVSRHDLRPDIYPRECMTDHGQEDRFCGIDLAARAGTRPTMSKVA